MILDRATLERIVAGEVDLVFRRWQRATVKAGGTLTTSVGVLGIDAVDRIDVTTITDDEAARAGFPSADALRARLRRRDVGDDYRIAVHVAGADPRTALREDDDLAPSDVADLRERLARLDRASTHGPWTHETLRLIAERPAILAATLADSVGREKAPFKVDVRKLKALGLTESLEIGYRLSPRGRRLLELWGA